MGGLCGSMKRKPLDRKWKVIHSSTVKTGKLKGSVLGNSNKISSIDIAMEKLMMMSREELLLRLEAHKIGWLQEDACWNSITENDKLYELELKPEVDIASYELRKMADARKQYTDGRFAVLSNLVREITDCEVEWAKREIHCLTRTSIEKIDDNLFDVMRVVDRVMYPD